MQSSEDRIVYILDDDLAVRDATRFLLEVHGFVVHTFGSPRAFLGAFDPGMAGCLLLDLHMPEMSGVDVLKDLRSRGIVTPVIVVSGHSDAGLDDFLMNSGAMASLRKPPDDEQLIGLIRRALAESGAR